MTMKRCAFPYSSGWIQSASVNVHISVSNNQGYLLVKKQSRESKGGWHVLCLHLPQDLLALLLLRSEKLDNVN